MTAAIVGSRIVHGPDPATLPKPPGGPVAMPELRVEADVFGTLRLVDAAGGRWGVCASRAVGERTRDFFGGHS